jgi:O-antigen ligase
MTAGTAPAPRAARAGVATVRLGGSERAAAVALCALLFLSHLAFGAARRDVALGLAALQGLLLALVLLGCGWARNQLTGARPLIGPAVGFGLVVAVGLWSLTPWVPGGPHPTWAYVQAAPAAAVDRSAVLIELLRLLGLGCAFLTAWLLGADDDRARWFLRLLVGATAAFAAWAFVSHEIEPGVLFGAIALPYGSQRLSAAFLSANTAATLFGLSAVLAAAALVAEARRTRAEASPWSGLMLQRAAPALLALAFAVACLLMTASRGGAASTALGLAVFLGWEAAARRWRLIGLPGLGLLALGAILLGLVAAGGGQLGERLFSIGGEMGAREAIVAAHWRAFLASPWMGYGLGSFDAVNGMVATPTNYARLWNVHAAHNVYLQWLEEGGALGAAAMFGTVGAVLLVAVRGAGRRVRMTTWIRGLLAAALVPLVHGLSDFGLQVPSIAFELSCVLGLAAGLAARSGARVR